MSSAVIIILREMLEAALLVSVLLAYAKSQNRSFRWLPISLLTGLTGAFFITYNLNTVTNMFDGIGQEILNVFY